MKVATSKARVDKPCDCLRCNPDPNRPADPIFGYELSKVPKYKCVECGKKIDGEPYVEAAGSARFGAMFFRHRRCETQTARRERLRITQKWKRELDAHVD